MNSTLARILQECLARQKAYNLGFLHVEERITPAGEEVIIDAEFRVLDEEPAGEVKLLCAPAPIKTKKRGITLPLWSSHDRAYDKARREAWKQITGESYGSSTRKKLKEKDPEEYYRVNELAKAAGREASAKWKAEHEKISENPLTNSKSCVSI